MSCECETCRNNLPFDMPQEIIEAYQNEQIVFFCGAGISTEQRGIMPYSFYRGICMELGIEEELSFSKVMSLYCAKINGRRKLLEKIKARFDYIHSFPELERKATRFHKELAELPNVQTIVTTNWDTYFEEYCGATPITIAEDFAFWDCNNRRVIKLHGSMNNISTIIATEEDYDHCFQELNTGIIGSTLKTILATKTLVFVGFSFGDEDLSKILSYVESMMKDYSPHIFVVTLDGQMKTQLAYEKATVIVTDGSFFLHRLKHELLEKGLLANLGKLHYILEKLEIVCDWHDKTTQFDYTKYPQILYCLAFQDGIIHAFERFLQMYRTGEYNQPNYVQHRIFNYIDWIERDKREGNYWDLSYHEGYFTGLAFILGCDTEDLNQSMPLYYLPSTKLQLATVEDLFEELKNVSAKNGKYQKYAKKALQMKGYDDTTVGKIIPHHPPY